MQWWTKTRNCKENQREKARAMDRSSSDGQKISFLQTKTFQRVPQGPICLPRVRECILQWDCSCTFSHCCSVIWHKWLNKPLPLLVPVFGVKDRSWRMCLCVMKEDAVAFAQTGCAVCHLFDNPTLLSSQWSLSCVHMWNYSWTDLWNTFRDGRTRQTPCLLNTSFYSYLSSRFIYSSARVIALAFHVFLD